jgi:hypothetical protein
MHDLVTMDEARYHLRLDDVGSDGGPDDPWLQIFIPVVSDAIATWLKDEWRLYMPELDSNGDPVLDSEGDPIPALDSNGDPTPRPVVRGAALVELGSQFRFREGEGTNVVPTEAGHGYILSKGATALLAGLRKSTVR